MAETSTASHTDEHEPGDEGAEIADLVAAWSGDHGALDEIVDRCSPMLRAVARRYVRRPADVDDVVQDAPVSFVEHLDHIRTPAATRGWLVTVATHAAWRAQRRASRAAPVADVDQWWADDDTEAAGLDRAYGRELRQPLVAPSASCAPATAGCSNCSRPTTGPTTARSARSWAAPSAASAPPANGCSTASGDSPRSSH